MKKITKTINILFILIGFFLSLISLINGNYIECLKRLSIIIIIIIVYILKKVKLIKLLPIIEIISIIFIFISLYIGQMLDIYNIFKPYDKIVHSLFGIYISLIGLYILIVYKIYKKNKIFNIMFINILTLACASIWEILEFVCDNVFKTDMQSVIETGVGDTMYDIIVAFIFSILFSIFYFVIKAKILKLYVDEIVLEQNKYF